MLPRAGVTSHMTAPTSLTPVRSDNGTTKHAIIIGAGPAGLAVAGFLAKSGWQCDVYESGTEERAAVTSAKYLERAYGLSCQARGIDVLERLHALNDVLESGGYWRKAVFRHRAQDDPVRLFDSLQERTVSCLRTELVGGLLKALRRDWSDRVTIHWESPAKRVVFNKEKAQLMVEIDPSDGGSQISCLSADVIVCADGSNSPIGRRDLARLDPNFREKSLPSGYMTKTILFSAADKWIPASESLHLIYGRGMILLGRDSGPRPSLWSGILTMLVYPESHSLSSPDASSQSLRRIFKEAFTSTQLPLDDIVSDEELDRCAKSSGFPLPGTSRCSHYHHRNFILLGDAAHCTPTNAAQGVNCALQDAYLLSKLIEEYTARGYSVENALAQFTKTRKPDMDALQRMMNHPFFRSTEPTWRSKIIDGLQWTRLPCLGPIQTEIARSRLPYSRCEINMLLQYHAPVFIAAVSLVLSCWTICFGVQHLHNILHLFWKKFRGKIQF